MKKMFFLPIGILVLISQACALPSLSGQKNGDESKVLFSDEFSAISSGWDEYNNSDGSVEYAGGGYRIRVASTEMMLWGNPAQDFQNDVRIAVDVTKGDGPDDNAMGIICRYQDVDNFYLFMISSDGFAGIARYMNNTFSMLSGESMELSDAINPGAMSNHMEAGCIGNDLTLLVNGTQIASASDSSFSGGDVGLFAKSFSEGGVDILFDNLVVSKP